VIHYIIADDEEGGRNSLRRFLQRRIEKEFGAARGTTCGQVDEVLKEIEQAGSDFNLLVLDLDFYESVVDGGVKILAALTAQQRRRVVVYSGKLDEKAPSGRSWGDEIVSVYAIPANRVLSINQGSEGLWKACTSVLSERGSDGM
jgi:DNA-binding LytR/AlgR family response regulator